MLMRIKYSYCLVGELQVCFYDVVSPPELVLTPHFHRIVIEVKPSGTPRVLQLGLWVNEGMLPEKYFCFNKSPVSNEF